MLQSYAQETSPCKRVNALMGKGNYLDIWYHANGATDTYDMFWDSLALIESVIYGNISQERAAPWQLVPYNNPAGTTPPLVHIGMAMIPPIWIVNFMAVYVLSPPLAALMPAYWAAIPEPVVTALVASPTGQVNYTDYQQYFQ